MDADRWDGYEYHPSFILGFHGCEKSVAERILSGEVSHLEASENAYDWLGHGIYFWEGSPDRAFQWARNRANNGFIKEPFVLGAVIDLGHCLDLFDAGALRRIEASYELLRETSAAAGTPLPVNVGAYPDMGLRKLDCAVINCLHAHNENYGSPYDSVRGPFLEGEDLYPNAGFKRLNHIQICVRHKGSIKGYFRPISSGTPEEAR